MTILTNARLLRAMVLKRQDDRVLGHLERCVGNRLQHFLQQNNTLKLNANNSNNIITSITVMTVNSGKAIERPASCISASRS